MSWVEVGSFKEECFVTLYDVYDLCGGGFVYDSVFVCVCGNNIRTGNVMR